MEPQVRDFAIQKDNPLPSAEAPSTEAISKNENPEAPGPANPPTADQANANSDAPGPTNPPTAEQANANPAAPGSANPPTAEQAPAPKRPALEARDPVEYNLVRQARVQRLNWLHQHETEINDRQRATENARVAIDNERQALRLKEKDLEGQLLKVKQDQETLSDNKLHVKAQIATLSLYEELDIRPVDRDELVREYVPVERTVQARRKALDALKENDDNLDLPEGWGPAPAPKSASGGRDKRPRGNKDTVRPKHPRADDEDDMDERPTKRNKGDGDEPAPQQADQVTEDEEKSADPEQTRDESEKPAGRSGRTRNRGPNATKAADVEEPKGDHLIWVGTGPDRYNKKYYNLIDRGDPSDTTTRANRYFLIRCTYCKGNGSKGTKKHLKGLGGLASHVGQCPNDVNKDYDPKRPQDSMDIIAVPEEELDGYLHGHNEVEVVFAQCKSRA